jgi:transcriptional regulator with XRE-family HTH domain
MDEQAIIKASITAIFNENGYSDTARMTQRDFDHIAEQIQTKSGVLISGTTIKRLAYGEFSRLPQIATLNAIANYFNYTNWQDYKTHNIKNGVAKESSVEATKQPINKIRNRRSTFKFLYIASVLIIIVSVYFFVSRKEGVSHGEKASFSFRKNTSNDIPNSVVFNYNVDEVQADSFFIQQSWDKNRRVRIYKKNYTLTDIYYEPGYHIAKLIANDSAIRTVDVSIPTDRWFFYAIDNVANYTPEYIKTDTFVNNGSLGLTAQQLHKNDIDVSKDKRYHYVYFPGQMNVPSDNFKFKTRVRMREVRNTLCPYIEVELYCQRSFMIMRSTTKGCAHEALIVFGEQLKKGNDTDLLPIAFDISLWTDIEITVKNRIAVVKVNDKEVFSTRYVTDTKNLAGLGYISNGLCEVDKVELTGLDGKIMYKNEF